MANRLTSPTPKWFRTIRNIAVTAVAVAGVIATAPIALPAAVVTAAQFVVLGGSVAATVAQTAKENE